MKCADHGSREQLSLWVTLRAGVSKKKHEITTMFTMQSHALRD